MHKNAAYEQGGRASGGLREMMQSSTAQAKKPHIPKAEHIPMLSANGMKNAKAEKPSRAQKSRLFFEESLFNGFPLFIQNRRYFILLQTKTQGLCVKKRGLRYVQNRFGVLK
jgi:hypothetical protein